MGVQTLGPKKHHRCEAIVGQPLVRTHTLGAGVHSLARCWVDRHHACVVNYRTGEIIEPVRHQGNTVAFFKPEGT
jgi:hypothetical protein